MLYYDAAQRGERDRRADLFTDVRAAFGAKPNEARDHLSKLRKR